MNDKEFEKLLKKAHFDEPKTAFSDNVMRQIVVTQLQPKHQVVFKPIISPKTWYIVLGIAVSVLVGVLILPQNSATENPYSYHFYFRINDLMLQNSSQNSLLSLCLIALSALLCLDYVLRGKYQVKSTTT